MIEPEEYTTHDLTGERFKLVVAFTYLGVRYVPQPFVGAGEISEALWSGKVPGAGPVTWNWEQIVKYSGEKGYSLIGRLDNLCMYEVVEPGE